MSAKRIPLVTAIAAVCAVWLAPGEALAGPTPGHKIRGGVELQFRTNDNVSVAPSSSDSFDFATFADFAEAEAKNDEDGEDEEDGEDDGDDAGDDDYGDDSFDDIGLDDTDLSEDEFDLATDDDDGDGDEDDEDDDGEDDEDEPDPDPDPDPDGKQADDQLDDLIASLVTDKAATRKQSLNRITAKVGLSHKYTFENGRVVWGSTVKGAGDFHNGKDTLDKTNFAASTGPELSFPGLDLKLKPALSYVFIRQHGDKIVGTLVGTLAAAYELNKQWEFDAAYNYQDRDITDPDSPDAIINTFTVGARWTASKSDIFRLRYSPKVEDSSKVTKNKDTDGWQVTYSRKLPWEMILGLGVKNDSVDFVNLPVRRMDDVRAYSIDLSKAIGKSFELGLAYETRELDSNLNAKDAKNKSVLVSAIWKF